MKKATIYDVAREAGVSLATVSRVINGSSVVREKTKEKVMKVIDELNFKPNQIARGLATYNYCNYLPTIIICSCKRYDWWYW